MQRGSVPKYSTLINSASSVGERGEALFNKEGKHASTKHNLILSERERENVRPERYSIAAILYSFTEETEKGRRK